MCQQWKELLVVDKPLDRVGVDLTDMVSSSTGFRYILLIIDHFSLYVRFFPLHTKTSKLVVKAFQTYCADCGAPLTVVADNGMAFKREEFMKVC